MAEQSDLEKIAIIERNKLKGKNVYNDLDGNKYEPGHTRALSDTTTPIHGKGTGKEAPMGPDVTNGGGDMDINGNPNYPGSGRIKSVASNEYNENKKYEKPDMSGNIGQVVIDLNSPPIG